MEGRQYKTRLPVEKGTAGQKQGADNEGGQEHGRDIRFLMGKLLCQLPTQF